MPTATLPVARRGGRPSEAVKNTARRDIQGLRMVAVVAVVLDHLTGWPKAGFIGVDVFFVISGYLITGLLLREHDRTGHISFKGFYARRIKRIVPAATLVLATTVAAAYWLTPGDRFRATATDSVWALLFGANWNFGLQGTDYFQEGLPPSPIQHYWSLSVEEQFYFVWPWLLLALLAVGVRRFRWGQRQRRVATGAAIGSITAASFAYAMYVSQTDPNWAYFSSFARAWELGVGAVVAVTAGLFSRQHVLLRTLLGYVGLAGICWSLFLIDPSQGFPAPTAALPVLATALVIIAGEGGRQPYLFPLTNRISNYLGDISYSLYLWHWPVIILLLAYLPAASGQYYGVAAALTLVLAVCSYHLVEDPIRQSGWLTGNSATHTRRRGWKSMSGQDAALLVIGTIVVALGFATATKVARSGGDAVSPTNTPALAGSALDPGAVDRAKCVGAPSRDAASGCRDVDLGETVYPVRSEVAGDEDGVFKPHCWMKDHQPLKSCTFGSGDAAAPKVALVGDSHAASLLPGLRAQLTELGWNLDTYTGEGCVLSSEPAVKCDVALPGILQRLTTGEAYDAILVTASRSKSKNAAVSAAHFADVWRPIAARGTKIIVIADNPEVQPEALQCIQRVGFDVKNNDCTTPRGRALAKPDPLLLAARQVPGSAVVDMTSFYCGDKSCPAVIGNVLVYRDAADHVTATYMKSLAPYLAAELTKHVKRRG